MSSIKSETVAFLSAILIGCAMAAGCASKPMQFSAAQEHVAFHEYSVLVVNEFESGVGEVVPQEVLELFPDKVIEHIEQDHPGLFQKVGRERSGTGDELVVRGVFTEYRKGSRFGRLMLAGLGSSKLEVDVSFVDGASGTELGCGKIELLWAMGGIVGASRGIEDLVDKGAKQIADFVAERKRKLALVDYGLYVSRGTQY